nr:putative reverse transcriptase domain-containing protein [Tanacetum cinerariifolium]
ATITGNQIKKFVWDDIVCRFGLPGEIISDNKKQFRDNPFKDWCEKLCIRQHFASVKHPQANGVEVNLRGLLDLDKSNLNDHICTLSKNDLKDLVKTYRIPLDLHPCLPDPGFTMDHLLANAIGIYSEFLWFSSSDAKIVEESHHLSLSLLERVSSHTTASASEGAIISLPTPDEIASFLPDSRLVKKSKGPSQATRPSKRRKLIGLVAYRLRLPEELSGVHDTFHVSNLKKCLADASLHVPLDEIKIDKTLRFVEEPVEIIDHEVKKLKRKRISFVKVRWNSKRGPEFTWEREDFMKSKYHQLFVDRPDETASLNLRTRFPKERDTVTTMT